jgi:oligopeptide/dipeptide ABC transporter ATP-binding protein
MMTRWDRRRRRVVGPLSTSDDAVSPTLFRVRELAARIGTTEVISAVNLEVGAGEAVGLVGETGAGKTVTCKAMLGLLGRLGGRVTSGEITYRGQNLASFSERQWRAVRGRELALVPQAALSSLDPVMTIGRQLREAVNVLDPGAPGDRAIELLEMVKMPRVREIWRSYPHQLSGGMRQRAMIALGIAGRPRLLIADEPTTALDLTVQRGVLELLTELRHASDMSMILVTHDLGVIETVTDRVAIMYAGNTVEFGPTAAVFERPEHPYTRALLSARLSVRRGAKRLGIIAGVPPTAGHWPPGCRFAPRCPYALEKCENADPGLVSYDDSHQVACIRRNELPGG